MGGSSRSVDVRELLSHADWVNGLARRLVGSAALADDAVQDTWVEVLERPPRESSNLRAWLGRVVANRVRQTGRAESRRRRREREAARPEAVPSMADLADRAATQREVVGHVLALDEPFRSVVLLRFFESLSPPEIAARLGVPLKTVHSRLQRAFEKLRTRLERDYGDSKGWCLALSPLLTGRDVAPPLMSSSFVATAGVWVLNSKVSIALVAAVLGGVTWWSTTLGESVTGGVQPAKALRVSSVEVAPVENLARVEGPAQSESTRAASQVEPAQDHGAAPVPAPATRVHGRAMDMRGAPLVDVSIVLEGSRPQGSAVTGPGGFFEMNIPQLAWTLGAWEGEPRLGVQDEAWVTVRQSIVRKTDLDLDHIVIAAPAGTLKGRIEDLDGAPVQGAKVSSNSRGAFVGFPHALDLTRFVPLRELSDGAGRFAFERFPKAEGLGLHVSAPGFAAARLTLDDVQWPLLIQLTRVEQTGAVFLEGFVVDQRGLPVKGARVRLADSKTKSDKAGFFRLPLGRVAPTTPLCAAKKGLLPALIGNFGQSIELQGGHPEPVELVLGGEPVEIHGRVIDDSGAPCVGWSVSLLDPTLISQYRFPIDSAEGFARGGEQVARTDRDGRFELDGLFPRDYVVQAFDRTTLLRTQAVIAGGETQALLRASREMRGEVRGIVLDRRGLPVPRVRLTLSLEIFKTSYGSASVSGAGFVTDESGEFMFDQVPATDVYVGASGTDILPGRFEFLTHGGGERFEIEVLRRCHFRIELADSSAAARFVEFYDPDGNSLQINQVDVGGRRAFMTLSLESGRSQVLSVSEAATTVLVKDGDGELSRHEILLDPSRVNVLRL